MGLLQRLRSVRAGLLSTPACSSYLGSSCCGVFFYCLNPVEVRDFPCGDDTHCDYIYGGHKSSIRFTLCPSYDQLPTLQGLLQHGAIGTVHTSTQRSEEHTSELQSLRHLVCR